MASRSKDERAHVNALIKAIQKNSPGVYVYIDRDAGTVRHTSSGFDFFIVSNGFVIFVEAKMENGRLTSWQEFVRAKILASGTLYKVIRFNENGEFFLMDDKKRIAIKDTSFKDFL